MTSRRSMFALLLLATAVIGCNLGYARPSELESGERGPSACAATCKALGMRMGALVLVERDMAGCICEPVGAADVGAASSRAGAAAVAGGAAIIVAQQQQRQAAAAAAGAAGKR